MTLPLPKRTYLAWSDRFAVGVPNLDADHKAIVELINLACAAWSERQGGKLRHALEMLRELAAAHFEREEEVLRGIPGYRALKAHAGEHRNRLAQLQRILDAIPDDSADDGDSSLPDTLVDWFVKQSIGHDAAIKGYFDNAR